MRDTRPISGAAALSSTTCSPDVSPSAKYKVDLPFDDESLPKLIDKIVLAQFECPSFFSAEAKDLICSILTPNPNKRLTIAQIKAHPWLTGHSHVEGEVPMRKPIEKAHSKEITELNANEEYLPTKYPCSVRPAE